MKKAFKTKLVKALRSGRYKQGQGYLFNDGRRCCLGVGCLVLGLRPKKGPKPYADESVRAGSQWDGRRYPTPKQLRAMGIGHAVAKRLANLNDEDGKSFAEIANYIEQSIETK